MKTGFEGNWEDLTDEERKKLKRGQFAFGSVFPYVFDGLSYLATYHKKLFLDHDRYYYMLELPINDLFQASLAGFKKHNRHHFRNELLKRGSISDKEDARYLRCIPIAKGDYLSIQPLMIGFRHKAQEEISAEDRIKARNLRTYNGDTNIIKSVIIYILKALIKPMFNGYNGGWFHCPTALQAKINHTLQTLTPLEIKKESEYPFKYYNLDPLFLRRYYLYLNSLKRPQKANDIFADAIDLWEHVSPSEIIVNNGYKYLRHWLESRRKLEAANRFFSVIGDKGLIKGTVAAPISWPKSVYFLENEWVYRIVIQGDFRKQNKREELCTVIG
jgi:hypothetical protein